MKYSRVPNSKRTAIALAVLAALPCAARSFEYPGALRSTSAARNVVVRACPHERLFADAHATSPDGRWVIGRATYEPAPARMVAEYRFVADSAGRRVLDRDFGHAFGAPTPGSDLAWLPRFPATLRYRPLAARRPTAPFRLALPPRVSRVENVCKRL